MLVGVKVGVCVDVVVGVGVGVGVDVGVKVGQTLPLHEPSITVVKPDVLAEKEFGTKHSLIDCPAKIIAGIDGGLVPQTILLYIPEVPPVLIMVIH